MAVDLHLPELPAGSDEPLDPAFIASWPNGSARWPSWSDILAMAVRDGASSVHYHPWRTNAAHDDVLSYLVGGTRYGLVAPDAESGRQLVTDARRLAAPGLVARLRAWVAGGAVGRLRLVTASGASEWCVVRWRRGRLAGVEFLRLSLVPVAESAGC